MSDSIYPHKQFHTILSKAFLTITDINSEAICRKMYYVFEEIYGHLCIKDLLHKVIERQEKIELSGEVVYGEPHHIGRKQKQVNISLRPPLKQPYKNL